MITPDEDEDKVERIISHLEKAQELFRHWKVLFIACTIWTVGCICDDCLLLYARDNPIWVHFIMIPLMSVFTAVNIQGWITNARKEKAARYALERISTAIETLSVNMTHCCIDQANAAIEVLNDER
jgi:hypothetical protein